MPLLDVSFMVEDPMLADTFDVRRRYASIGMNGRVGVVPEEVFSDVAGVVTNDGAADLIRTEDGQRLPRRITICSRFQFIAADRHSQPDDVHWNGVIYTILESLPYSRFGSGFYEATAEYRGPMPRLQ